MDKNVFFKSALMFCFFIWMKSVYPQQTTEQPAAMTNENEVADSIETKLTGTEKKKYSFWQSMFHGNIDRTFERAIDFSFGLGPYYNQEAGVGLGGMGSGLYRVDRTDSVMPPSNLTVSGNVSSKGFYGINFLGNHYFKDDRSRLIYELSFNNKVLNFWGINYDACIVNPVIDYTRRRIKAYGDYSYKIGSNFRIGGIVDFLYSYITEIDDRSYIEDQKLSYSTTGLGVSFQYDSRDFIPNPKRGIYLIIQETVYPEGLGSFDKTLFRTTFTADFFQELWKGGILAFDLIGNFKSREVPWALKEELGGGNRMRGYYMGRYVDNNIISTQVELRQHLFGRFGFATWIGAGTVFPKFNQFDWKEVLPSYGLGLRWEFKHNMNLRLDYGFGKESGSFVVSVGEAF